MEAFEAGDVQSAYIRNPVVVEKARNDGHGGMMFVVGAGSQIAMNTRKRRPGADVRVRRAVALALDVELYSERAHDGAGLASRALFPRSSRWSTGVKYDEPDLEEASRLVDEAKAAGWDGSLKYLVSTDPAAQNAATQIQAQLKRAGIEVFLDRATSIADFTSRQYVQHDFDMATSATNIGDPDPYSSLFEAYSSLSYTNASGYTNQRMDRLLTQLRANIDDPSLARRALSGIEMLLRDDVPTLGLSPAGNFVVWADNVHAIEPTVQEMVLYDKAWMSK
jgi:peptide/nickel transport system substrate-binding protein